MYVWRKQCFVCKTRSSFQGYRKLFCGKHQKRGHWICGRCRVNLEMRGLNLYPNSPTELYLDSCPTKEFLLMKKLEGELKEEVVDYLF